MFLLGAHRAIGGSCSVVLCVGGEYHRARAGTSATSSAARMGARSSSGSVTAQTLSASVRRPLLRIHRRRHNYTTNPASHLRLITLACACILLLSNIPAFVAECPQASMPMTPPFNSDPVSPKNDPIAIARPLV